MLVTRNFSDSLTINVVPLSLVQPSARDCVANRIESTNRILDAPRWLALWHLASLDAPTVAVVWSLAFAWAGHIHLRPWVPLLLALVTWSVYVGDRLLDARADFDWPARHLLRERHYFHWRHRRIFLSLAVVAACTSAGIVMVLMPPVMRARDSVLAAAAFAYFSGVHSRGGPWHFVPKLPHTLLRKEFLVGLLFTAGCVLPAWPRIHASASAHSALWPFWIPVVYFTALAWLNCACIARWESANATFAAPYERVREGFFKLRPFRSASFSPAALLAVAGLLLAVLAFTLRLHAASLLATGALSALLLALLDCARRRVTPLALRAFADLVLLTPLLLVPFLHVLLDPIVR